jgi:hypothetical protein
VEVMYGLVIALWILHTPNKILVAILLMLSLAQAGSTINNIFISNVNISWHNYPAIFHQKEIREPNISNMLADYDSVTDKNNILPQIDAFLALEPFPFDGLAKY